MKMPLLEPLCNKHDGLQTYEKENLDLEIFLTAFSQNTSGRLLLKVGSTIYLRFTEQTLFSKYLLITEKIIFRKCCLPTRVSYYTCNYQIEY